MPFEFNTSNAQYWIVLAKLFVGTLVLDAVLKYLADLPYKRRKRSTPRLDDKR